MTVALHNYLKNLQPKELFQTVNDEKKFKDMLNHLELSTDISIDNFVEYMLLESKILINQENRKDALIILKHVKPLLPKVHDILDASFYLVLADSFLLANDYEGAKKAVTKANSIALRLKDPRLQVRVLNMFFVIHRTIGKDKALDYLEQSKKLSEEHEFYDNIVFCNINIGLMHYFNKEYNKAADYCTEVIDMVHSNPYPDTKLIMPTDYFLQVFSETPGLVTNEKYQNTILGGVKLVLRTIRQFKNDIEATRRLTLLTGFLKVNQKLVEPILKELDAFVDKLSNTKKSLYYSALASGISDFKNYQYALIFYERAMEFIKYTKDDDQRTIKKHYSYALSMVLGVSMLYDLQSSQQTTQMLKNLGVKTNSDNLVAKSNQFMPFKNAVKDSDAAFGVSREFVKDKLLTSIKDRYKIHKTITHFRYSNARDDLLENLELFIINTLSTNDEVESLLFVGTTMNEKELKRKKKVFSGYQIIGHIIPPRLRRKKHIEDFDIEYLYRLIRSPQKFKEIEILTLSDEIETTFVRLF
ncbi:hypothetical protein EU534_00535 [Candidatus Heimdallarchaeota archaeon]|nr:MAG: hypothetical protein EU534_00535 [Candidatus Heimdallarchaeota archaeon]